MVAPTAREQKAALLDDPLYTGYDDIEDDYDGVENFTNLPGASAKRRRPWTMIMLGIGLIVCLLTLTILLNPLLTPRDGPNPHEVGHSHDGEMEMGNGDVHADEHHHDDAPEVPTVVAEPEEDHHHDEDPETGHDEDQVNNDENNHEHGLEDVHDEDDHVEDEHPEDASTEQEGQNPTPTSTEPAMSIQTADPASQGSLFPLSSNLQDRYILDPEWDYSAEPARREYNWTIRDEEYNPDGVFRPMMLINHQFPGPLIEINEGDTIVVNLENLAVNATSIHWHGLYQNGTNFMDGTVGVTQCPVAPGTSFTYEFKVPNQSGTYWYHSHQSVQTADGLFGPLIIHGRDEKTLQEIPYDTDRVIMVSDHYHDSSSELLMAYLASDRENIEPVPDSALINGQGIRDCSTLAHRRCDNSTTNVARPEINLEAGMSHRLRFINTGTFAEFQVAIDEHDFSVTEVDGTDVHPATYNRLTLNPAQRYSVIVNTTNDAERSYWLRAKMLSGCFGEDNPNSEAELHAVVRYVSGPESNSKQVPDSREWSDQVPLECHDMNTTDLVPVVVVQAPERADASFYIRANFEIGHWALSRGFFNTSSWRADLKSPTLLRTIDGLTSSNESFTTTGEEPTFVNSDAFDINTEFVIQSNGIQVIDLLVENFDDGNHPLHLHGYKFFVLAAGHGYPPANLTETVDLTNPLRRDTASVEAFGWVLLRVVADNPGLWAFHCHVAWHTEAGLMMQLLTRADEVAGTVVPDANVALCDAPREELEKGSSPKDEVFFGTPA
ncbi:hypothetical protein FH972_022071 [Carpinus fangiana]|uniref:Laccase n=1 Tax=Carpinus fangiana TaxID=176857 RepID=A0A5N6KR64_9ROSI|nr:hypothetical protein FH972_022071 [Carpinus fangiana]